MPNKNLQYKKTKKTTNTKLSLGYLYGNMLYNCFRHYMKFLKILYLYLYGNMYGNMLI